MSNAVKSTDGHQHLRGVKVEHTVPRDPVVVAPVESEIFPESCTIRRSARLASVASTCSTALADWQSELADSSTDGDASLVGQVWVLSQDPAGSRQVQGAMEAAGSHEALEALAAELHGRVAKAMRCPHANHVLQKCIELMRPEALQFIVDELSARDCLVVQAAKHRYACRIVQQVLRKCPASQTGTLAEALLRDAIVLACHTIGHYTIQQVLELGTEDQRYRLVRVVEQNMRSIGQSSPGGAVIRAAMAYAASEDKIWVARAVLQDPDVLLCLASGKQGSAVVELMLDALDFREMERAREVLLKRVHA